MSQNIKQVVIVGGGSAGWMTAAYLSKALEKDVRIRLVESSNVATIGVGEATFSTIRLFFDFLGLDEADWMPHCNATYKMGIKFVGWNAEGRHFYHPFQRYEIVDGFNIGEWWYKLKRDDEPFDYSCFTIPRLCDMQRSPRYLDGTVFDEKVRQQFEPGYALRKNMLADHKVQYPYAYHFDAALLAKFMCGYAMRRGVERVLDDVVDVTLTEDGSISHIVTKEHGPVEGDLFIDCTGFRGLLINKALGEPFIPFAESLLCDSAVAIQIPRDIAARGLNPYTTATALSSGWAWNIPLYGRDGTGYVYSSAFRTPEEAEREFREHLGPASDGCKPNHIKMRIGRSRNSWVKNCVGIGLASGFVEPLESTGIFFIQHGIEELVSHFPNQHHDEQLVAGYNRAVAECIDGVRDFLTLHYRASTRADTPFWKATKEDIVVPDRLKERMELWQARLPNHRNINLDYHGFEFYSYSVMLLGLGYRPGQSLPVLDHIDSTNALKTFSEIRERADYLAQTLPSQYEYLTHVRSEAANGRVPDEVGSKETVMV
jgi:tryptophan halogenase